MNEINTEKSLKTGPHPIKDLFRERLNLLHKNIKIQIIILMCWIVAFGMYIYAIVYESLRYQLIRLSILPSSTTWIWIIATFFLIGGGALLWAPVDIKFYEREIFMRSFPEIYKQFKNALNIDDLAVLSTKIEDHLEQMDAYGITQDKIQFLELLHQVQVNKFCKKQTKIITELIQKEKHSEAITEYNQLRYFIEQNLALMLESQIRENDELANQLNIQN